MKHKHFLRYSAIPIFLLLLTGCVIGKDTQGNPTGVVWDLVGKRVVDSIDWFAGLFNHQQGSYALGIIIITFILRLVLAPFMVSSMKQTTISQEKMTILKPELDKFKARMQQAQTPSEQMAIQREQMAFQKEAGIQFISPIGCLPAFIQLILFSAVYFAVITSPTILNDVFLGIPLNEPSILLAVLSSVAYLIQGYISQIGMTEEQKKLNQTVLFIAPVMNIVFAIVAPAGASLYWTVGGLFMCLQTLYTSLIQKPRIREQIKEELKNNPIVAPDIKDVTPTQQPSVTQTPQKRRNEGKQNRQ